MTPVLLNDEQPELSNIAGRASASATPVERPYGTRWGTIWTYLSFHAKGEPPLGKCGLYRTIGGHGVGGIDVLLLL